MTSKRNRHLGSAIGPATREQLEQWAREYDRMWDRTAHIGVIVLGASLIGVAGMALAIRAHGFNAVSNQWVNADPDLPGLLLAFLGMLACALVILWLWWHYVGRTHLRSVNPYRPIGIQPGALEEDNADCPTALAYLDAIRHQGRPIVKHDLDVLAMIRQQQRSNCGG